MDFEQSRMNEWSTQANTLFSELLYGIDDLSFVCQIKQANGHQFGDLTVYVRSVKRTILAEKFLLDHKLAIASDRFQEGKK